MIVKNQMEGIKCEIGKWSIIGGQITNDHP